MEVDWKARPPNQSAPGSLKDEKKKKSKAKPLLWFSPTYQAIWELVKHLLLILSTWLCKCTAIAFTDFLGYSGAEKPAVNDAKKH